MHSYLEAMETIIAWMREFVPFLADELGLEIDGTTERPLKTSRCERRHNGVEFFTLTWGVRDLGKSEVHFFIELRCAEDFDEAHTVSVCCSPEFQTGLVELKPKGELPDLTNWPELQRLYRQHDLLTARHPDGEPFQVSMTDAWELIRALARFYVTQFKAELAAASD